MPRRAARTDANQTAIVQALRKAGALVHSTAQVGSGFPDIVVAHRKRVWLLEIKDGAKVKSAQKLTDDEEKFHQLWKGYVHIVRNPEEALNLIFNA